MHFQLKKKMMNYNLVILNLKMLILSIYTGSFKLQNINLLIAKQYFKCFCWSKWSWKKYNC
ncbi:hypothetical protein [Fusobacterium vincentii ATCC 49256]|uniref:Uncharacterized protein n=1 Tax=Fusobacterium vincentii ATCC 49256 TaxID=209882 RepID=Q7P4Y8_FUSVC|nr:hypothetical protein [Fusobacterium vincentii ATCC 49256]